MKTVEFSKKKRALDWLYERNFKLRSLEYRSHHCQTLTFQHPAEGVIVANFDHKKFTLKGQSYEELRSRKVIL